MKKHILTIAFSILIAVTAAAQEYKISKNSGRLEIYEVNHVTIEGTTGNEIIFTGRGNRDSDDERAKGLRAISASGLEDNTGIGLSAVEKGANIEVRQLKKMDGPHITIKVPKGVEVAYSHTSPHGDPIEIKNFDGAVSVNTVHGGVRLTNVTGNIDIKTIHGDVEASLVPQKEIRISSAHGHIDIALPVSTKADLSLTTQRGEIFVDPDFKIDIQKTGDMVRYDNRVNGKINGGGLVIQLNTEHSNIYLRKKA